ncbi:XRE family transcriptional regulator [Cupriavidus taiwanensis]|uniref:Putative phage-related DNA-binding protein n=1 Tax=Cupriavidus taiwanensis TaxID=164546 RepID=A0A375IWM0_9BURK|nr:XRE family transcriptional regulator [Cupriavidus taiwanensis]SPR97327.1 putative phage-related DNA-binding protein [Cupriavidus taiwanensis]
MRRSVTGFRGERLSQVLDARRLTQVQLASMIDVSPATISKWRNNQQNPDPEKLDRLAAVVNVAPEWFLRSKPESAVTPPLFRSNASALVSARALMHARLEWAEEIAATLEEYVDFPSVDFPTFEFKDPSEISDQDIELAAVACRTRWRLGLGPVPDVVLAIENAGGVVIREVTGVGQIEGVSRWHEDRPFVLLCADKANAIRGRFDAAHELGHIVLHRHIASPAAKTMHKELERQAHRFAAAFLLPAETFAADCPFPPTLDTLLALKSRWKASVAAMIMRLHALELIDDNEKLNLFKRLSARFGRKAEPRDDMFLPEEPRLLRKSIELLVDSGTFRRDEIHRLFGLSAGDIHSLGGLPSGYLNAAPAVVLDLQSVRLRRAS